MSPKYVVRLSSDAANYLRRVDRVSQGRLLARLDQLGTSPFDPRHSKPLRGSSGLRSSRVGALRIIFRVNDLVTEVLVSRIGPRGQVYRGV